jgi:deoxyribodipyrimidine photo-lyase
VTSSPVQLVWFKRDLRVRDHAPLRAACAAGPVLALYVYEPELLAAPDMDGRHLTFLNECLRDLELSLRQRGGALVTRVGRMPDVLDELRAAGVSIAAIHAHEETGNGLSYARDRRVRAWARVAAIPVYEQPNDGVVRRLSSRDVWAAEWSSRMRAPLVNAPARIPSIPPIVSDGVLDAAALEAHGVRVRPDLTTVRQSGGERVGRELLRTFLWERGRDYRRTMASPMHGPDVCSRISPHLAFGTLSVRQAVRGTEARAAELTTDRGADQVWLRSLGSFLARLQWRGHFMQKLEDEPALEYQNVCDAYDGLRSTVPDPERLGAWSEGRTGYPLIDACMRSVAATGWLPFRMRAMVMSFAAYHLWLHWREPALVLARWFTDYEPGIHYSQCQMQSGTTGINTFRIYNPYLQHERYDATHAFVRRWVPELAPLPDAYLIRPSEAPLMEQQMAGCIIGRDYPQPIVPHEAAYQAAKEAMYVRRRAPGTREAARAVYERHGSRRQPWQQRDA